VKLGHIALDGTKVRANASKHKAMSYGRMKKKEKELEREVRELLKQADTVDVQEDEKYGKGVRGDELPKELRRRESRLKKIEEAKVALEKEAREKARVELELAKDKIEKREKKAKKSGKKPRGKKPVLPDPDKAEPKDSAQRNFTDPDSRIMVDGSTKSFEQCYNAQAAVDDAHQVIVACSVTNESNDKKQLKPTVEGIEANVGEHPRELSADAGYFSEDNVQFLEKKGIDGYVATGKMKHGEVVSLVFGHPPEGMSVKEQMNWKLRTDSGRKAYNKRKGVVEPVFGQIKGARGLRQFLLRGIDNVSCEWDLWCITHNLLKLYRFGSYSSV
jgi:hypothetical protein